MGEWFKSRHSNPQGNCLEWRTSSHSVGNGACVEVAPAVQVRDSKDPDGPVLLFTPAQWRSFTGTLQMTVEDAASGWPVLTDEQWARILGRSRWPRSTQRSYDHCCPASRDRSGGDARCPRMRSR